jgi:hypothetical protein
MRVKVRILKFGSHASDGSVVSSDVVKQYLDSPEAQESIRAHRMIGSLTHRVRNIKAQDFSESVASNLSKTIGMDDGMLITTGNGGCPPTHYIDKMWIENGAWWAEIQIYDENDFDDDYCSGVMDGIEKAIKIIDEQPTIEPVQRGEREINADELLKRLDQYFEDNGLEHKWTGDEIADSMSGTVEDIVRIVKEMLGESDDEDEQTWW